MCILGLEHGEHTERTSLSRRKQANMDEKHFLSTSCFRCFFPVSDTVAKISSMSAETTWVSSSVTKIRLRNIVYIYIAIYTYISEACWHFLDKSTF